MLISGLVTLRKEAPGSAQREVRSDNNDFSPKRNQDFKPTSGCSGGGGTRIKQQKLQVIHEVSGEQCGSRKKEKAYFINPSWGKYMFSLSCF